MADRIAAERSATIVESGIEPGLPVGAPGAYQRRNFALAMTAAEAYLGRLEPEAVAAAAASVRVPGRLQQVDSDPLTLLDGAHNPDGTLALVESLTELAEGHGRVIAVVSILDDKDAAAMLRTLNPAVDGYVLTSCANPRALPPPTLRSLVSQLGGPGGSDNAIVPDPRRALARARELAGPGRPRGGDRLALSDCRPARPSRATESLQPVNDEDEEEPRFLAMIGLVALVVAIVVLVFFGIGYLFGRAFL